MMRAPLCSMALLLLACAGCAPTVYFEDRDILWDWPDDRPIAQPPHADLSIIWESARDALFMPSDRVLGLDYFTEAKNVNALDELPDSAWFHDRRRVEGEPRPRHFSVEEITRGALDPGDEPVLPFTVTDGKGIGATPGFVARDARGRKYLVKLDPKKNPGLTTSTEIVVNRLAWASGWLVPGLALIDARREDVKLSPKATTHDSHGEKVPMTEAHLKALLDKTAWTEAGTTRMLASLWLPGVNVGEYAYFGRRADDPNDLVEHEDRRDLRGLGVFFSWVNNVDAQQNNTLDMYQGEPGRGHVVHYAQDVGGAFGNFAGLPAPYWIGQETYFQPSLMLRSLVTFGLWPRPWADERFHERKDLLENRWPELGNFSPDRFDPLHWQPILENAAFARQTARDRYWGAKRVVAVDERELRAAIAVGQYRPEAAEWLFQILWQRREIIARAFFGAVAPLDYFRLAGDGLCFDDLWTEAGLGDDAIYGATFPVVGRCVQLPRKEGYLVVTIGVRRGGKKSERTVRVHLMSRGGERRIVGIER